jgi:hypothetical protein
VEFRWGCIVAVDRNYIGGNPLHQANFGSAPRETDFDADPVPGPPTSSLSAKWGLIDNLYNMENMDEGFGLTGFLGISPILLAGFVSRLQLNQ